MTREEFGVIVKGLKAVYTQANFLPDKDAFNIWYELLKDLDYQVCNIAVQSYMVSEKFPPTIADIREYAYKNSNVDNSISDSEAWDAVRKAISDATYHAEEKFISLPNEEIKKAVGSPNQLRIWAMDEHFNDGVVQSNFLKSYRNECEKAKSFNKMPERLQTLIAGTSQKLLDANP